MTQSHEANVLKQFSPQAAAYVASAVHAGGADLDLITEIARANAPKAALDLGCGGGHVAYRLAEHAQTVTAYDLSAEMIRSVLATAQDRGLMNLSGQVGAAEAQPFADAQFDFVASRYSAHHWSDLDAGLREAFRVLTPGATAVFADVVAPAGPVADTHLQTVELLRDPSHVRDYSQSEWLAALGRAGFRIVSLTSLRLRLDFTTWTERMLTPAHHIEAIRSLQKQAPSQVSTCFAIEPDGTFSVDTMVIEAQK